MGVHAERMWRIAVGRKPKLRRYMKFKKCLEMEQYLKGVAMLEVRELARLRCSSNTLMWEMGRKYPAIPEESRICPVCEGGVEHEVHVLFEGREWDDIRGELWGKMIEELDTWWVCKWRRGTEGSRRGLGMNMGKSFLAIALGSMTSEERWLAIMARKVGVEGSDEEWGIAQRGLALMAKRIGKARAEWIATNGDLRLLKRLTWAGVPTDLEGARKRWTRCTNN